MRQTVLRLDQLPYRQCFTITAIDWEQLDVREARRLQEFGFAEGVAVETLHRGPFQDPIACRVGSMTIALRRALAAAIVVQPA